MSNMFHDAIMVDGSYIPVPDSIIHTINSMSFRNNAMIVLLVTHRSHQANFDRGLLSQHRGHP